MRQTLIIILSILLFSCKDKAKKWTSTSIKTDTTKVQTIPKNVYLMDNGGCVHRDSIVVDSLGNNLYKDHNGNIYFKTFDRTFSDDYEFPVLITRLYNACEGDSTFDLKNNIDLTSFVDIGFNYYADKNKIFYHNYMSDGGNLVIADDIDRKSFKLFPHSFYGIDKKRVYYKGSIVELADRKTFECIYSFNGKDTVKGYAGKDKKYYFSGYDTCSKNVVVE